MDYQATQNEARNLLAAYAGGRFPVPVIEIALRLGINVLADPNYPNDGSGHIEIDANGNPSIIVNENQSATRKRFTIAHEIAHFVFDKDYLHTHRIMDRNGDAADATYRGRERRANYFAANILMPEDQFVEQWLALRSIDKIADYFSVSKEAAKIRAMSLGLIAAYV